jgi:tyrosine-specific transport protein
MKMFGAILLVAGAAIGAGMLGMPIVTGFAGFYPSLILMVLCWGFLLLTSILMVEVNLSLEKESNIISMAEKTLGKWGKMISWIVYLFLLYALDVAFLSGGSEILHNIFPSIPAIFFPILIMLPLSWIIYCGIKAVDHVNRYLVIGKLGVGYAILIFFIPPHIKGSLLTHVDFSFMPFTLPIIVQAFGFHTVVASLVNYLDRDVKKLKIALTIGSLISLVVYAIWELLVLGVVPVVGEVSISKAYVLSEVSTTPLIKILHTPIISTGAIIFALLAVITAFLGVSIGLFDFWLDGLKIKKNLKGKVLVWLLSFLPSLIFVYTCKRIFLVSLEYAGAFVAIIFGLIPILMAFKLPKPFYWTTRSGRTILVVAAVFFSLVIFYEILGKIGLVKPHL